MDVTNPLQKENRMTSFSKAWKFCSKPSARRNRAKLKRQIRRAQRRNPDAPQKWDARLVN
jgi:hypothetical protein